MVFSRYRADVLRYVDEKLVFSLYLPMTNRMIRRASFLRPFTSTSVYLNHAKLWPIHAYIFPLSLFGGESKI